MPTPAILHDRDLVVQILHQFPEFLLHSDIPPNFFADRDIFEATVGGILRRESKSNVLCLVSSILRNDAELVLQTLPRLYGRFRLPEGPTFVGQRLCDDKEFCLLVVKELSKFAPTRHKYPSSRQMLDLSHLSDRLQLDPAVVAAFCRLDGGNYTLAPEGMQCEVAVIEAHLPIITFVPPCPARSELESSVPFVVLLLKQNRQDYLPASYFMGLPTFVREDREVSLEAATAGYPTLVHPRWTRCVDFWCDAIRKIKWDFVPCFKQIPLDMRDSQEILNGIVRHPRIDNWFGWDSSIDNFLFEAPFRRVNDYESLRKFVRFAKALRHRDWDPNLWRQIPQTYWEDKGLSLNRCPGSRHSTAAFRIASNPIPTCWRLSWPPIPRTATAMTGQYCWISFLSKCSCSIRS